MKIYHGSPFVIKKPELSRGKPDNDYGRGFYCTEDLELAREWACKRSEPPAKVNVYELSTDSLRILDLSSEKYGILNWIAVLLANRKLDLEEEIAIQARDYLMGNFMPPGDGADVIIGYRADDSYFRYAESFVGNGLSVSGLERAMRLGKLGLQVALVSEKAFSGLQFIGVEDVDWREYHPRYVSRDISARREWADSVKAAVVSPDDLFVVDIMRRGIKTGDAVI